jgi:Na+/phosphate symporter
VNTQSEGNGEMIDREEGEERQAESGEVGRPRRSFQDSWWRQVIGALIGGFIALALAALAIQLGWIQGNVVSYALWGGVIGGIIGGSASLEQAGSRLTQRDAPLLNIIVALVGMLVVFGVLFFLVWFLSQFLRRLGS